MAVSSTSFEERLTRLDSGTVKLYAGDYTPQKYKADNLICAKQKVKKTFWTAILSGVPAGALAGYMFKSNVGIEMFFSQSLPVLYAIIKADPTTAAIYLAMLAGPVCTLGFLIFDRTQNRLAQFGWSYLAGSIGVNLTTWYYFYLAMSAGA
ncbi:MAG: hypothetical protein P8Q26_13440 [Ascidiaceihabitans sp.]|nr:hypothetical protein [Ascidiaceihabitans sp.]